MIIFQRKHPARGAQRGVAIIETALTLPLLLLLLFGIMNYGIALYNKAVITNASREAARAGIVFSSDGVDFDEVEAIAVAYCADKLITFGDPATADVTVDNADAETLRVRVEYDFESVAGGLPGIAGLLNLSAETLMKYEV